MMGDAISWDGWPACGEIDIMETMNAEEICFGRLHWTDRNGRPTQSENFENVDLTSFHTYSVVWTPSMIRWFVDDIQYHYIGE